MSMERKEFPHLLTKARSRAHAGKTRGRCTDLHRVMGEAAATEALEGDWLGQLVRVGNYAEGFERGHFRNFCLSSLGSLATLRGLRTGVPAYSFGLTVRGPLTNLGKASVTLSHRRVRRKPWQTGGSIVARF